LYLPMPYQRTPPLLSTLDCRVPVSCSNCKAAKTKCGDTRFAFCFVIFLSWLTAHLLTCSLLTRLHRVVFSEVPALDACAPSAEAVAWTACTRREVESAPVLSSQARAQLPVMCTVLLTVELVPVRKRAPSAGKRAAAVMATPPTCQRRRPETIIKMRTSSRGSLAGHSLRQCAA
jgi:hypothetical protein